MTITRTASAVSYGDTGVAEPALLCLPGWCGDRTVFDPLVAQLAPARRVLTLDLPDHGGSPRTDEDFGTSCVVDQAVGVIEGAGLAQVVPVALAHAGWMALELRRRLGPERVPAVVLVDWMVLGTPPGFTDALAALQDEAAWERVRAALFSMWTDGVEETAVHEYVASMGEYGARHWSRAGREIARGFAAEPTPLAVLERLEVACPTLHLYAQPADQGYLAAQQGYAAEHPWFQVRRLDATSHFPTFEAAAEMAAAVSDLLARVSPSENPDGRGRGRW